MAEQKKLSPRMSDVEVWDFVQDGHTGIYTTLRRDGVPIAMPMWYACVDRVIYMQTRGKKLQRIQNDPRSSFLVETGDRWGDLVAVHLTGVSEHIEPDEATSAAFAEEMDRKYSAFRGDGTEMPAETKQYYASKMQGLVRFAPDDRVLNWDNSKMRPS